MTRQDSDVLFKEKFRVALKTQRLHKHLDTLWDMGVNMTSKLATLEWEDVQDTGITRFELKSLRRIGQAAAENASDAAEIASDGVVDRTRQADASTDDEEKGAAVVVDKADHGGGVNNDDEQARNQDLGSMDSGGEPQQSKRRPMWFTSKPEQAHSFKIGQSPSAKMEQTTRESIDDLALVIGRGERPMTAEL